MNKFDFAASVIKASPMARLTDRAFAAPVFFVCVVWVAAMVGKTSIDNAIDFTKWVLGTFIVAEKGKDAITSFGALTGGTPQSVAVGSVNSETAAAPTSAAPTSAAPTSAAPASVAPTSTASAPPAAMPAPQVPLLGRRPADETMADAPVGPPIETFAVGDFA